MKNIFKNWLSKQQDSNQEDEHFKFIWGIKSFDDISGKEPGLYTLNDIDIVWDKASQTYLLSIEEAYLFEDVKIKVAYLNALLDQFTKYIKQIGLETDFEDLSFSTFYDIGEHKTISDLYNTFRLYVKGYEKIFGNIDD